MRKQGAIILNELIGLTPHVVPENIVFTLFQQFFEDHQDSIRMQGVDHCVAFAKHLPQNRTGQFLVPFIKKFAEDKSWRIRYLVADRLMDLAQGIGFEEAKTILVPYYVSFLTDAESEVRTAALGRMTEFCRILDKDTVI